MLTWLWQTPVVVIPSIGCKNHNFFSKQIGSLRQECANRSEHLFTFNMHNALRKKCRMTLLKCHRKQSWLRKQNSRSQPGCLELKRRIRIKKSTSYGRLQTNLWLFRSSKKAMKNLRERRRTPSKKDLKSFTQDMLSEWRTLWAIKDLMMPSFVLLFRHLSVRCIQHLW